MIQKVRNKEKYDKLNISERRGEGFVEFRHYILIFFQFSSKVASKDFVITFTHNFMNYDGQLTFKEYDGARKRNLK